MSSAKFKPGDIIWDPMDRVYKYRVLRTVKKDEDISGPWWDSAKEKTIPYDSYLLEGYRSGCYFLLGFSYEDSYEVVAKVVKKELTNSIEYNYNCPKCGAKAYAGLSKVECSKGCF